MDPFTTEFISQAEKGESVYIADVRRKFLTLDDNASFPVQLVLTMVDGSEKVFALRFPRFSNYPDQGKNFVTDFFLAEVYNIFSCLGGSRLRLVDSSNNDESAILCAAFNSAFCLDRPRYARRGYGRSLNVIERMLTALHDGKTDKPMRFHFSIVEKYAEQSASPANPSGDAAIRVFQDAAKNLEGKAILGVDIGGTDIKLALAVDGALLCFKEYDWFPAMFTEVRQLIDPVIDLVKAMACEAGRKTGKPEFLFDAIGMCFPDVVVNNKIVGGEVFKTRGIRDALGRGYDSEFAALTDLDVILRKFVKADGCVGIINDGPMAAFAAGVESAVRNPQAIRNGVFAYTLGTELGTGYVTSDGAIPDIPLEVYNFIIDLGSRPERDFEPDDLRSINNFNTRLPGTLQKYACQSGVFRLAFKYLKNKRPDLVSAMKEKGFIAEIRSANQCGLYVPTDPRDMRKPFLEYIMELVDSDGDPGLKRIFEEIGITLAVTGEEIAWILEPTTTMRMLFGRLVKRPSCFQLMYDGAKRRNPDALFSVADDSIAGTPLMTALSQSDFTVAQFAQAVGAVHYGNHLLNAKAKAVRSS